jgi:hypothetical protein
LFRGDSQGNLFVAAGKRIYKISATDNLVTTYVGNPDHGITTDNTAASSVYISLVIRISGDSLGNVYYIDSCRIRKVLAGSKLVSTVVGSTSCGSTGENTAALATKFQSLLGLWLDTAGNIVIGDDGDRRIRKFTLSTGLVATIAGNGTYGFSDNLPATAAMFRSIYDIVGDTNGNIYFSDWYDHRVRQITTDGILVTYVGDGGSCCYAADGLPAASVRLDFTSGLQLDTNGNLYVSDSRRVLVVNSNTALVTTFIGGCYGNSGDGGPATSACMYYSEGLWIDTNSYFYLSQVNFYRIRKVASNIISTFAGSGYYAFGGDGGPAKKAQLDSPAGTFVDTNGNVFIADEHNCRVRLVDTAGIISTFGGTGACDSTGNNALFSLTPIQNPRGIWKDTIGNLFLTATSLVRKVAAATNIVTTIAGGGGSTANNILATSYLFNAVYGIWGDTVGSIFVTDYQAHIVKKLSLSTSVLVTVTGNGVLGFVDNVPASSGQIGLPTGLWVDSLGKLFIADMINNRIRKVENGFISTYAGTGGYQFNGEGHLATATNLGSLMGLTGDSNGNIYFADPDNKRIRMIYAVNNTANIVKTIIGSGSSTFVRGTYLATTASLSYPQHVSLDTNGGFYICENNMANTVRKTVLLSAPTRKPSRQPTGQPTAQPKNAPSSQPSQRPSVAPSFQPTAQPISHPTNRPTNQPTSIPSKQPRSQPTNVPSSLPSCFPSTIPSNKPTGIPSTQPSSLPSQEPSSNPSSHPTFVPTGGSTARPTQQPSGKPSNKPSSQPSVGPSALPSSCPSDQPSSEPSGFPSGQPTSLPSNQPSSFPTNRPTCVPTSQPSGFPSVLPSDQPSVQPNSVPTTNPTSTPTFQPTVLIASELKEAITGFYSIDEGSLNDKSGNGNNGKAHGGITFTADRFGSEKSSIQFDGNSGYIEIPARPTDQLVMNFTVSFWMYPNISQLLPGTVVFDKSVYFMDTWGWSFVFINDHIFEFSFSTRQSGRRLATESNHSFRVSLDVPDTGWSHITLVKEVQTLLAYRDGHSVNSTIIPLSFSLPYSSLPLVIGTSKEVLLQIESIRNSTFYSGGLDDIFIYDRALSAAEIAQVREFFAPTSLPSGQPTTKPSVKPSLSPSARPTTQPVSFPSSIPTKRPSGFPSSQPTTTPSRTPSNQPTSCPSRCPSVRPTLRPSRQPSAHPSSQPLANPSSSPSTQPSNHPTQQPIGMPSSVPSSQPLTAPTMIPSVQPSNHPTNQPTSSPSSQPSSQPTKNRFHCTVVDNKFYSSIRDDCVPCPLHSFLNHTGDDTCYCNGGYSQVGVALSLNCTVCSPGHVSFPGSRSCIKCISGFFANSETNSCELCALSFYSSDSGQTQCTPCPAGRATAVLGSTSLDQCISPIPNFTLGSLALFLVVVIFSWYIVFGKFQRVSFERKVKIVTPNIEKCKQVLLSEEEFHYQHLIVVQDKKNHQTRKFKFFSFAVLSIVLMIVSVFLGFVFFTYHAFFTSLILWRGLKADLNLSPILTLLAEGLKDITEYISLPVNLFYFVTLPFLYLFQALAKIDLNLSSVNVTCSGSQAPIELLINCFILGLLIIIIRSDYQLLFNILLNNLNQRFLLNNVEQRLDAGNFRFSRHFFICLIVSALNSINPFQVGLRYCMGFVRIDTFGKNHGIAHEITESCNQVPGAPHFDSFLGYMSTIFAWWLILPAVYCLAEVVVPKCKKIDPLKKRLTQEKRSKKSVSKIFPADLFVDESVKISPDGGNNINDDDEDGEESECDNSIQDIVESDVVRLPEFPDRLSTKFPGVDETVLAQVFQEGYKERLEVETGRKQNSKDPVKSSISQNGIRKFTKRLPFILAFYYYCKQKYFLIISVDLWVSNLFSAWISVLKKNTLKASRKEELLLLKQVGHQPRKMTQFISAQESSLKTPGVKQLFSRNSSEFIQGMHLYDLDQMRKQKEMDSLWQKERLRDNHSFPSYYDLSLIVRDELHDFILEPLAGFIAFLGIGHFFTPTGRYYWKVVLNNYKIFLCVCLGIWTDEGVEAYGLEENSVNLSVDGRAFLYKSEETTLTEKYEEKKNNTSKNKNSQYNNNEGVELPALSRSSPSRRKFSAQVLGVTISRKVMIGADEPSPNRKSAQNRSESEKQNIREVLPVVISVLICSRVILFQIVPSLVLFATVSMTLASFPLFIFNDFLVETLPALIIYGAINREMAIERELKSFVALHPETKEVLSEVDTIRVLSEEYSWRLSVRGIILFWNESRLLQFIQSSLTLFFSFLLLIYTRDLLVYLIVILGILFLFILSKSLVLLLYLGSSLDVKDSDFPNWLRGSNQKLLKSTAVAPDEGARMLPGSFTPSSATVRVNEQRQIENDEENTPFDINESCGGSTHQNEVDNAPEVFLGEVNSGSTLSGKARHNENPCHQSPELNQTRSCQEEGDEELSTLDFDDFDFSDITPSIKEEKAESPSFPSSVRPSELQSSTNHKTDERSSNRINDGKERSYDRNADQYYPNNSNSKSNNKVETNDSAANNFPEKKENGATDTSLHQMKTHSCAPHQVSDSEENSDSDDEEDDDLEEYMNAYLQAREMDLESGFSFLSLKK